MKKLISIVIAILLVFQVNIIVFAAEKPTVSANKVTLTEKEALIPVEIKNNTGLMGYKLTVKYDATKVEICSITKGDVCAKGNFVTNFATVEGRFDVVWNNTENVAKDGSLFVLSAKAKEKATGSSSIDISYSQPDTFDVSYKDVALDCKSIDVAFAKAEETTAAETETKPETNTQSNTWVADDKQMLDAINTTLRQEGISSLDEVKDKDAFNKKLTENLNVITGSSDNKIVDFDSLKEIYKNSYSNEFIKEVTDNIENEAVQKIINNTLKKYNADDVRKLSDEDKASFMKDIQTELQNLDNDVSDISDDLSAEDGIEVINQLDKKTKPIDNAQEVSLDNAENKNKIAWIVLGSVLCAALLVVLIIVIKKKTK